MVFGRFWKSFGSQIINPEWPIWPGFQRSWTRIIFSIFYFQHLTVNWYVFNLRLGIQRDLRDQEIGHTNPKRGNFLKSPGPFCWAQIYTVTVGKPHPNLERTIMKHGKLSPKNTCRAAEMKVGLYPKNFSTWPATTLINLHSENRKQLAGLPSMLCWHRRWHSTNGIVGPQNQNQWFQGLDVWMVRVWSKDLYKHI